MIILLVDKHKMQNKLITLDYIRGLIEGEGCFTFSTQYRFNRKVPCFEIGMHARDMDLLEAIRDRLGLHNKIYVYHYKSPGINQGPKAILIVREFAQLRNIVIPLCYNRLKGNKAKQFNAWMEKIGADPMVSPRFKFLYKMHKWGHFTRLSENFVGQRTI